MPKTSAKTPKRKVKTTFINFRVDDAMLERLRLYSEREDRTLANAVLRLVTIGLAQVEAQR